MPTAPTSQTTGFHIPYRKIFHTVKKNNEIYGIAYFRTDNNKTNIYVTPLA
jgi:hypothetical protein